MAGVSAEVVVSHSPSFRLFLLQTVTTAMPDDIRTVVAPPSSREAAERLQIYERLSMARTITEKRLSLYLDRFCVGKKEKLKKLALANTVCKCRWPFSCRLPSVSTFVDL